MSALFREDATQHRDVLVLPDADAQHLAALVANIRELVWHYREQADWAAMLDLLDLVQDLVRTQYRTPTGVFQLDEIGTAGLMTLLDVVATTLLQWAVRATVPAPDAGPWSC